MPRIFAVDWDRHEVRGLLVSSGPTGPSVTGAWAVSLATVEPDGLSGKQIGARLAAAMAGESVGKATTLIAVGRDNVQMKLLSLPPAPADDLPDMVRFQAEREFTSLGEGAALDFIPLVGDEAIAHQALAVALSPSGLTEAREACDALGVEPDKIPLRACAAAALVERAGVVGKDSIALVVNPLFDEADLVVQTGDKVVLMRTVRLPEPAQVEARSRALLGEIRRTMAAVRQQLTDQQVDSVVLCGNRATLERVDHVAADLDIPVTTLDPAAHAPNGFLAHGLSPESQSRFSAVLGMALGELDRRAPVIDFASPRRRREARRYERVHVLAASAAAVGLLAILFSMWRQYADPARELAALETKISEQQQQAEIYKSVTAQAKAVNRWLATDVNWLDELEEFARKVRPQPLAAKDYPVAEDAVMTQLTLLRPPGIDAVGGRIDLQAIAKSPQAVAELEQRLRDERHRVSTGVGKQDRSMPGYEWLFNLDVYVTSPDDMIPPASNPPQVSKDVTPTAADAKAATKAEDAASGTKPAANAPAATKAEEPAAKNSSRPAGAAPSTAAEKEKAAP
jgi:Tfp pilus assembly PilM family ATPase